MTKYITHKQSIFLNQFMITKYTPGEPVGVKDKNMLDSAIMRPRQSINGEDAYPTIAFKAAALFQSLAQNHPFFNANKRTALACLHQFLYLNSFSLAVDQITVEDFTVFVVIEKPELQDIASWISDHMKPRE